LNKLCSQDVPYKSRNTLQIALLAPKHTHTHTHRERERKREREQPLNQPTVSQGTVTFTGHLKQSLTI